MLMRHTGPSLRRRAYGLLWRFARRRRYRPCRLRTTITPAVSGHHHEPPFWAICMPFHKRAIENSRPSSPMAMSSGPPSLNGFCIFVSLYSAGSRDHGVGECSHYPLEAIAGCRLRNGRSRGVTVGQSLSAAAPLNFEDPENDYWASLGEGLVA